MSATEKRLQDRRTHTEACKGSLCPCYQEGVNDGRADIESLAAPTKDSPGAIVKCAHCLEPLNRCDCEGRPSITP